MSSYGEQLKKKMFVYKPRIAHVKNDFKNYLYMYMLYSLITLLSILWRVLFYKIWILQISKQLQSANLFWIAKFFTVV